jgi:hypothetical protein
MEAIVVLLSSCTIGLASQANLAKIAPITGALRKFHAPADIPSVARYPAAGGGSR